MSATEEFIPWEDEYALGVPLIDEQHEKLVGLLNALYDTCRPENTFAPENFKAAVETLLKHFALHFSTEKNIMARVDYPGAERHNMEHEEFVKNGRAEFNNFKEGRLFVPSNFVNFAGDWTLSHIVMHDKRMVDYILDLAKKGQLN